MERGRRTRANLLVYSACSTPRLCHSLLPGACLHRISLAVGLQCFEATRVGSSSTRVLLVLARRGTGDGTWPGADPWACRGGQEAGQGRERARSPLRTFFEGPLPTPLSGCLSSCKGAAYTGWAAPCRMSPGAGETVARSTLPSAALCTRTYPRHTPRLLALQGSL